MTRRGDVQAAESPLSLIVDRLRDLVEVESASDDRAALGRCADLLDGWFGGVLGAGPCGPWRSCRICCGVAPGVFNVTAPRGHATYGKLLQACLDAAGAGAQLVWADADWLNAQGVQQWTQMPLWRTSAGTWAVDSTRAQQAGLTCRPLSETVADTWQWLQRESPVPHARQAEHGLPPEREAELLAAWQVEAASRGRESRLGAG